LFCKRLKGAKQQSCKYTNKQYNGSPPEQKARFAVLFVLQKNKSHSNEWLLCKKDFLFFYF